VSATIKDELDSNNLLQASLFMHCISDEKLNRLERLSLQVERSLFPENRTAWDDDAHHGGFQNYTAEQKKHCHVDNDTTLKDKKWIAFFKQLKFLAQP
jgi:hypothetical protein